MKEKTGIRNARASVCENVILNRRDFAEVINLNTLAGENLLWYGTIHVYICIFWPQVPCFKVPDITWIVEGRLQMLTNESNVTRQLYEHPRSLFLWRLLRRRPCSFPMIYV